ncbi:MAG TPA: prepilin-type N-terminal cleavage/methylation domain-containing protein [Candidatus Acidoferrum sp.]|nr:prepilin-type N-terminal cleavage/methylation domain-containing protein [Candidatus Acidoferrum sp.]
MITNQGHGEIRAGRRLGEKGFSLIELLIVVAIILIIAAIAIPNLLKAKMAANEASAVSSIHAINTAEIAYSSAFPSIGYSAALADLGPGPGNCSNTPTASCYIDAALASGTKSGYTYLYVQDTSVTPSLGYSLNVDPLTPGVTGQRHFYSDQNNVTHYTLTGTATSTDSALQ